MKTLKDLWVFLPIIPYFVVLNDNNPNIPIMDDYDAVLRFLLDFKHADFTEKFRLLMSQHNEHHILSSRLIFSIYDKLFGGVNFSAFKEIAFLQLVVVGLVAFSFLRRSGIKHWQWLAFIWMLLVFDLNTYENASIAMYGMQNFGVLMLFFVTLYLWMDKKWLILAVLAEILLIFSSGNGMIGAFCIAVYVGFEGNRRQIACCGVTALIFSVYYLSSYVPPPPLPSNPFDIGTAITYFIRMTGAPVSFDLSLMAGLVVLAGLALLFPIRALKNKQMRPLLCVLAFVLGSMGTISLFRSCLLDAQFQTSRYLIYPQLLLATLVLFCFFTLSKIKFLPSGMLYKAIVTMFCLVFWHSNYEYGKAGFERMADRANEREYYYPDPNSAAIISKLACDEEIYCK